MKDEQANSTSAFETFLYALIGVVVVIVALIAALVAVLGEWVILALASFVVIGIAWFFVWVTSGFWIWLWSTVGDKREDWADRRLNREIMAATTRSTLMLEDKRSNLVYAQNGFLPVAYTQVMDGTNNTRLLDLAAQRIETLKLPENVPNHLHVVTQSDTDQTLNAGANTPSVDGNLGDLSFLLPAGQSAKYRVLENPNPENNEGADDEPQ